MTPCTSAWRAINRSSLDGILLDAIFRRSAGLWLQLSASTEDTKLSITTGAITPPPVLQGAASTHLLQPSLVQTTGVSHELEPKRARFPLPQCLIPHDPAWSFAYWPHKSPILRANTLSRIPATHFGMLPQHRMAGLDDSSLSRCRRRRVSPHQRRLKERSTTSSALRDLRCAPPAHLLALHTPFPALVAD